MTKKNPLFTALCISLLSVGTLACGVSPLLHHQNAADLAAQATQREADAATPNPAASSAPCQLDFPKSGLCGSITWDTALSTEAENTFTLRLWNKSLGTASGPYMDAPDDVGVMLWMPSMGHGSSPVTVTHVASGVYSATRIYFIMSGAWDIRVQLKSGNQLVEQAVVSLSL